MTAYRGPDAGIPSASARVSARNPCQQSVSAEIESKLAAWPPGRRAGLGAKTLRSAPPRRAAEQVFAEHQTVLLWGRPLHQEDAADIVAAIRDGGPEIRRRAPGPARLQKRPTTGCSGAEITMNMDTTRDQPELDGEPLHAAGHPAQSSPGRDKS
jgi:hypothetical protein